MTTNEQTSSDLSGETESANFSSWNYPGKVAGVSLVSPAYKVDDTWTQAVRKINAEWTAILPYGYSYGGSPKVNYNAERQWWGERVEGMTELIRHAHQNQIKVMLKPMVWIVGSWPGGFQPGSDSGWKEWERSYSDYILTTARIAEQEQVELFCIGTEFKIASNTRPRFWRELAAEVRKVYSGPITYAANWDEYEGVHFWDAMDVIGIDAYFPLVGDRTPEVSDLIKSWTPIFRKLKALAMLHRKKLLFTEFGYRSIDGAAGKQWELESIPFTQKVNMQAQIRSYEAFFRVFWDQDFFAGMFLWQWYTNDQEAGGTSNSDYTPQNKPVEQLLSTWFR